ncbi:MAG: flagellar biosynthesis protein FliQ [Candidatus Sericytochromatia bacterium]|nr:flagellar biosynthesis protein FliQ [Candidatus Tanganyikabacteria bacterium]
MTQEIFLDMVLRGIIVMAIIGGPALLLSLIVGLIISIFQAVTQINEATLTFIPKIAAVGIALVFLGPWMLQSLIDYTANILISLPRYAH